MKLTEGEYFGSVRRGVQNERVSVLLTSYEPLQTQPWHTHEHPTLFIHLRGTHFDSLPDRRIDQPSLSVVYHPPTTAHRSEVGPEGMAGINIELKPAWFERFHTDPLTLGGERLIGGSDIALQSLWLAVARNLLVLEPEIESSIFELLISRRCHGEASTDRPRWLQEAKARVEAATDVGGVAELAGELAIHPGHLSKTFRRWYGTTVTAALQSARLARASRLILMGMSAGEAALESGFSDQFYLSRCLVRRAGIRPRELAALRREMARDA